MKKTTDIRTMLTTKEVAELRRVTTRTVARWIEAGQIPATRIGRGKYLIDPIVADPRFGKTGGEA